MSAIRCVFKLVYSHGGLVQALAQLSVRKSGFVITTQQTIRWATSPTARPPNGNRFRIRADAHYPDQLLFRQQLCLALVAIVTRLRIVASCPLRGYEITSVCLRAMFRISTEGSPEQDRLSHDLLHPYAKSVYQGDGDWVSETRTTVLAGRRAFLRITSNRLPLARASVTLDGIHSAIPTQRCCVRSARM